VRGIGDGRMSTARAVPKKLTTRAAAAASDPAQTSRAESACPRLDCVKWGRAISPMQYAERRPGVEERRERSMIAR